MPAFWPCPLTMISVPGITIGVSTGGLKITWGFSPSAASPSSFFGFTSIISELGVGVGLVVVWSMASGKEVGVGLRHYWCHLWGCCVVFGFLTLGVGFLVGGLFGCFGWFLMFRSCHLRISSCALWYSCGFFRLVCSLFVVSSLWQSLL